MIVVGLTGSVGMGKSTAAGMLRDMGIPVHDADAAVHDLLGPGGAAVAPVADLFPGVLKKDRHGHDFIDRGALGQIVFAEPDRKKKLEDLLHPLVRARSDDFVSEMEKDGHDLAVLDIPLLFETGAEKRVGVTICMTAPKDIQRARVMARPGMTEDRFAAILASQMPDEEKRRRADYVVDTAAGLEDTRRQLGKIVQALRDR